jgi:putative transposase
VASEVGIDLGVTHFAALSNGTFIESPQHYRKAQADLKRKQRALSRKKRGSHRREKARKAVAKAQRNVANQRRDFHHKQAKKLVGEHQVIVFEELQLTNLVRRPKTKQDEDGTYLPTGGAAFLRAPPHCFGLEGIWGVIGLYSFKWLETQDP